MHQIWLVLRIELECLIRQRSSYIFFALLLTLSFFQVAAFQSGIDGSAVNSPFQIHYVVAGMSMLGLPVIAAIAGGSICKEFSNNTYPLTFTTPVGKTTFLIGRFLASYVTLLAIFLSVPLGCSLGSLFPLVQHENWVNARWPVYLLPYIIVLMPNLLFSAAIMFSLGAIGHNISWVYLAAAILFAANMTAGVAMHGTEANEFMSILEPFGSVAFVDLAEHATVQERNTTLVPLSRLMLINRIVWISFGLIALALTLLRFKTTNEVIKSARRTYTRAFSVDGGSLALTGALACKPQPLRVLPVQIFIEFLSIVARHSFAVIAGVVAWMVFSKSRYLGATLGTSVHPITSNLLGVFQGGIEWFLFLTIALQAGQLVWRERDANADPLLNALPVPNWLPLASKTIALMLVQALLLAIAILCAIAIQAFKGHDDFELAVYLKAVYGIEWVRLCLLCVFAIAIHAIANQKYLAYLFLAVYLAASQFAPRFGMEHHLLRYGSHPGYVYSDMSGFGNFVYPIVCFNAYWVTIAVLLATLSNVVWVRGHETTIAARFRQSRDRWTRATRTTVVISTLIAVALGGFIFYNTNVLNQYQTRRTGEALKIAYEREFKSFQELPHPRITAITAYADIYPEQRRLHLFGNYQLKNKTNQIVERILLSAPPNCQSAKMTIGEASQVIRVDQGSGTRVCQLGRPLQPGETVQLKFDLKFAPRGFSNQRADSHFVENGTYIDSSFFPRLGYIAAYELTDAKKRRDHDLPSKENVSAISNQASRRNQVKVVDADWINLDLTIGTAGDQVSVAPGSILRQWGRNGRRYTQFRSDSPMLCFFPVLSARYEVKRERWNDVDLEIYFHPGHEYNIDLMMKAMKRSLEYYTSNFGPYHNTQLRIVEVPRTHPSAKAFSGIIPFSEGLGFVLKQRRNDSKDRKVPFVVTAHETAHQWWAHQVIGADVQGSFMLSETLAQYSALMVTKKEFGDSVVQRILREELNAYLKGRAGSKREMPLALEERQAWIHYHKGSLVMYTLQDYLGEATVNNVLASYVEDVAFQEPPYTTSLELVDRFRNATPKRFAYLIDDLFTSVTLHDNRCVSAFATKRPDGRFEVKIAVECRKYRGTRSVGKKQIPIADWIDVAVTNAAGEFQYLEKHRFNSSSKTLTVVVSETPRDAGIDPKHLLIDTKPGNNTVQVNTVSANPSAGEPPEEPYDW